MKMVENFFTQHNGNVAARASQFMH